MAREIDMLNGKVGKKLLMFAAPLALTGMLQQLFNAADTAVVGRLVGANAMAAVGSVGSLVGLLIGLVGGISIGTTVVISQATGRRDKDAIHAAVHTSILVALVGGILLTCVGEEIALPMLRLLGSPEEVIGMSLLYLRIYLAGMPLVFLYNIEAAIVRTQGDTRTPLVILTISGVLNVVLNLFFVAVFHIGVAGVALATMIANGVSAVVLFAHLTRLKSDLKVDIKSIRVNREILKNILTIGLPSGLQGSLFSISNLVIQSAINSLGATVMAGAAAAANIDMLSFYIMSAFGQAGMTFVGQNYGAGDIRRCRYITRVVLLQGILITSAMGACLFLSGHTLLGIFNRDPAVIEVGLTRMKFISLFAGLDALMEILSGILRAYGWSLSPAIITLMGVVGTRILWVSFVFPAFRSFTTLMVLYPISWAVTSAVLGVVLLLHMKKRGFLT